VPTWRIVRNRHTPILRAIVSKLMRQVIIYRGEDGYWVAEVPSLPGCVSQGRTKDEALANAREAIEAWTDAATQLGRDVPSDAMDAEIHVVKP